MTLLTKRPVAWVTLEDIFERLDAYPGYLQDRLNTYRQEDNYTHVIGPDGDFDEYLYETGKEHLCQRWDVLAYHKANRFGRLFNPY